MQLQAFPRLTIEWSMMTGHFYKISLRVQNHGNGFASQITVQMRYLGQLGAETEINLLPSNSDRSFQELILSNKIDASPAMRSAKGFERLFDI